MSTTRRIDRHKASQTAVDQLEQAYTNLLRSLPPFGDADQEDIPEFRDFIESVSVSQEALAALVSMPELSSIYEAKKYVQGGERNNRSKRDSRPKPLLQTVGPLRPVPMR